MSGTPNTPLSHIHVDGHVDSSSRVQPPPTQPLLNGRKFSPLNAEHLAAMPDAKKTSQEKLPTAPQATGAGMDKLQQAAKANTKELDGLDDDSFSEATSSASSVDAVSGANASPQIVAEHIATEAVSSILTFNRTPFALAKDKTFEPMIMVNGHPIFIEKDGPHIVIGDVKNKGTLNEAREVSIALHAALESPAVSEASKAKLRTAIQAEDLPTLSREETTKAFNAGAKQSVEMMKERREQLSKGICKGNILLGVGYNNLKREQLTQIVNDVYQQILVQKLSDPETSDVQFIAAVEVAEERCPENLTEEMRVRAASLRKKGFSEQEKAEIAKRRYELSKEFDAAIEHRIAQLEREEASHQKMNLPLSKADLTLLNFLRVSKKIEREEKIQLLLLQTLCMNEMRHNRRQLEKWLSEIRMKDDEIFREGIEALDEAAKEMRDFEALLDKEFSQSRAEAKQKAQLTVTS